MFYIKTITFFSALAAAYMGPGIIKHYKIYRAGAEFCKVFGSEVADPELVEIAQTALKVMDVKKRHLIRMYKGAESSCAASWQMWLAHESFPGPLEFVIFHEAAHIALGHFDQKIISDVTYDMVKAQEIEADLLACQKLFELGKGRIIIQRIQFFKDFIASGQEQMDTHNHPSLDQMVTYLTEFARSKGLLN